KGVEPDFLNRDFTPQLRRQLTDQHGFQDEGCDREPDKRVNHQAAQSPPQNLSQDLHPRELELGNLHTVTFCDRTLYKRITLARRGLSSCGGGGAASLRAPLPRKSGGEVLERHADGPRGMAVSRVGRED